RGNDKKKRNLFEINEHSEKIFNKAGSSVAVLPQPELGNLAHALIADVSLRLPSGDRPWADEDLQTWLRAALANQGRHQEDPVAGQALALARGTLQGAVGEMIRQAEWVSFEHPIAYHARQDIFVEGQADLVVQGPREIGVIDFKSSHGAVTSQATFVQLCGYARAFVGDEKRGSPRSVARTLEGKEQRPVWMAAARLGGSQPLVRRPYDDEAEAVFQQAVHLAFEQIQARVTSEEVEVQ
ncbi:MAG: PD-(D/E)XK nuclease family protein, partial [Myxococcota bacterium]